MTLDLGVLIQIKQAILVYGLLLLACFFESYLKLGEHLFSQASQLVFMKKEDV